MRRCVICLFIVGLMLSVWGKKLAVSHPESICQMNSIFHNSYDDSENMSLQLDLVRWYNLNLCSERPDRGFQEAYKDILCLEDGIMGYVEFPSLGVTVPIYHDGAESGVVHRSDSPIPVEDLGNHPVLVCREPIRLQSEDSFVICILDQRLSYQVGKTGESWCTLICGNASYTCGRVVED